MSLFSFQVYRFLKSNKVCVFCSQCTPALFSEISFYKAGSTFPGTGCVSMPTSSARTSRYEWLTDTLINWLTKWNRVISSHSLTSWLDNLTNVVTKSHLREWADNQFEFSYIWRSLYFSTEKPQTTVLLNLAKNKHWWFFSLMYYELFLFLISLKPKLLWHLSDNKLLIQTAFLTFWLK